MFAPHQIVCLECDQTLLYGEVIQVLETRQMCWVRPLVLVNSDWPDSDSINGCNHTDPQHLQPIVDGPDLLWPLHHFYSALDTDAVAVLAAVSTLKPTEHNAKQVANQRLRQFVEALWAGQSTATGT